MKRQRHKKPSQNDAASSDRTASAFKGWLRVGMCSTCLEPIEAWQPGGLNGRHINDKTALCWKRTNHE